LLNPPTKCELAHSQGEPRRDRYQYLVPLSGEGCRPPLFFIPAGIEYLPMASALGEDQPVIGLSTYSEVHDRQAPDCLEDLAADYIQEILDFQPQGPYFLCGFSLGGVFAFEIARQLVHSGRAVAMVGLLDSFPHGIPTARRLQVFAPHLLRRCSHHARSIISLRFLSEPGWLRARSRAAGHLGRRVVLGSAYKPDEDGLDRVEEFNPYFSQVGRAYSAKPSDIHVTLFHARDNHRDIPSGWRYLAKEGVTVHKVPGGHMGLFQPEHSQSWISTLRNSLHSSQQHHCTAEHLTGGSLARHPNRKSRT